MLPTAHTVVSGQSTIARNAVVAGARSLAPGVPVNVLPPASSDVPRSSFAGWMWMHGVDGADKSFYTTGRLTSEMVMKAAQMGVPIVVSRNGVTQMGHELATRLGMTLFGRAANRHFLCYSGFERFDAEPEPAPPVARVVRSS